MTIINWRVIIASSRILTTIPKRMMARVSGHQRDWPSFRQMLSKSSCVMLNHAVDHRSESDISFMSHIWNSCHLRISVDGGTNGLFNHQDHFKSDPDIICGDFDSIHPHVLSEYEARGVRVVNTPDPDQTDFTKSIMICNERIDTSHPDIKYILAFAGSSSGRMDQFLSNLHTLHKFTCHTVPILLCDGSSSLSWVLNTSQHHVIQTSGAPDIRNWCSLVPLCGSSTVTTSGLKWNLSNDTISFGQLISTSNEMTQDEVHVDVSDHPVLWSMKILNKECFN